MLVALDMFLAVLSSALKQLIKSDVCFGYCGIDSGVVCECAIDVIDALMLDVIQGEDCYVIQID